MEERDFYRVYSDYLKEKYGAKVYKLPVNLPTTCPNRDGCVGVGGCIFCGEEGAGFENLENTISVKEQLIQNMEYIRKKYKAEKFIAYFQNFTNTYMSLSKFKEYVSQAVMEDIVEISISTRPDCISDEYLEILSSIEKEHGIKISMEIGLQTVNYHTLKIINRGHTLAEFIDSVLRIKRYGFDICAHLILNLPWDDMHDTVENAKILSALSVDQVKLHSLYVVEDTELGRLYKENKIDIISKEEYIDRVIIFLEYLDPNIVIQRVTGRAPEEGTLFVNWNTSWWKIRDEILYRMKELQTCQGKKYDYLNGKAVKNLK
ncbi:TIGR01212 family radical SAM protein [Brassicibacter mesophilus]|uniref:TIGR01212 family radical SAM protein n=1 Tax=Brassicibacter mesophilus TaxID=745119 RepID=UPI003D197C32